MGTPEDISRATHYLVDETPMPSSVPHVSEIGATNAPLASAAFFIGAHCKDYNEDFMLCKAENTDPAHCLKEGRKVTRCAADVIRKLREHCGKEFEQHWQCLDNKNSDLKRCREQERPLNECVFSKLGLKKVIPGTPNGAVPIHEQKNPRYV